MKPRVRFAPSPTGHMHIGNARTALFNYLFAKSIGATFILRIEDTDLERSTKESEQLIYKDMEWLGLLWDEGAAVGGAYGPYRQTERFHLYEEAKKRLIDSDNAYYCFCSKEELDEEREKALKEGRAPIYNGKCRHIPKDIARNRILAGEKAAVRFSIKEDTVTVCDLIHGNVDFPTSSFGDFIIVRPDNVPVYNFAVVIDDYSMKVTHVIRGDDHLSNTPKQILIYKALGEDTPKFAHIPMILGPDRSKLSKRHGNTSIDQFREAGYLPEALDNYMTLLSWSDAEGKEFFTLEEAASRFDLNRVSSSPAVFDFDKLKWMNGIYIRSSDIRRIVDLCIPYMISAGYIDEDYAKNEYDLLEKIILSIRDNLEVISDVTSYTDIYFKEFTVSNFDDETRQILDNPKSKLVLEMFLNEISKFDVVTEADYKAIMKIVQKEASVKGKDLYMPVRIGVTGRVKGPELNLFIPLIPVPELIKRLKLVISSI